MCFTHKQIISWPFRLQAFFMVVYFVPYIWHSLAGIAEGFLVFCLVPIIFPWDSHQVPQVLKLFPKTFSITSIALQFYPIWFCPQFNFHGYKLKRWAIRELICFYFVTRVQRCGSIGECLMTRLWATSKSFLGIWTFGVTQFWDLLTPKKLNWMLHLLRAFQHYVKIKIHLRFKLTFE